MTNHSILRRSALALALMASVSSPAHAEDTLETAGDIIQFAVPLVAFGTTYLKDDREGRRQLGRSALTTGLSVHGLKFAVEKWRPNFSATNSFPSGHTAAAFVGASFLQTRYGSRYGIPAYAAAAFVGYTRVRAEKHFSDDVLAGAGIAMLSNWLYTDPQNPGFAVNPIVSRDGYGMSLSFQLGQQEAARTEVVAPFVPRSRFALSFGALSVNENDVRAPATAGVVDLERFDTFSSPTTSSKVDVEWFLDDRHEVALAIDPLEVRDETVLGAPVSFNSVAYPGGVNTQMEFILNELRGVYRYKLVDEERFNLKLGGGLAWQYTWVRLVSGALDNRVTEHKVLPYLSAQANFGITEKLSAQVQIEGMELDNNMMLDTQFALRYALTPRWDVGFGVRRYQRRLSSSDLFNDFEGDSYFLTIGRSF